MTLVRIKDLVAGAVLLVLAIIVHIVARRIEARIPMGVDSGFFPEVASGLLGFLALVIILQAVLGRREVRGAGDGVEPELPRNLFRVAATCLLIVVYGLCVPRVGFVLATLAYLPLQFLLLSAAEDRNWPMFGVIAAVATGVIYVVFSFGFGLILPSGLL